jgi:hypothetical protein
MQAMPKEFKLMEASSRYSSRHALCIWYESGIEVSPGEGEGRLVRCGEVWL